MGRWHAHAIRRADGGIVAIVDPDHAKASLLAADANATTHPSLQRALEHTPPDVVHICTPLGTHVELVRMALNAGCHVVAEKPLAPSAAEVRALHDMADARSRLLVPVHQFLFQRGFLEVVDRLAALGTVLHVEAGTASAGAMGMPAGGPDAVAAEILPHFLAGTGRLLNAPVADAGWNVQRPRDGEWRVSGRCADTTVAFLISMAARPTFAEMRVLAAQGTAHVDFFHGFAQFESGTVSRASKITRPFTSAGGSLAAATVNLGLRAISGEPAYPGLNELVRRVYAAVRDAGPPPISPSESLDVATARDRLVALAAAAR
jgi:predicted dehydrogenase